MENRILSFMLKIIPAEKFLKKWFNKFLYIEPLYNKKAVKVIGQLTSR